jgi:hypothetical protein
MGKDSLAKAVSPGELVGRVRQAAKTLRTQNLGHLARVLESGAAVLHVKGYYVWKCPCHGSDMSGRGRKEGDGMLSFARIRDAVAHMKDGARRAVHETLAKREGNK